MKKKNLIGLVCTIILVIGYIIWEHQSFFTGIKDAFNDYGLN